MSKPCVFLLPGLLCDEAVWEHQSAALAPGFDVRIPAFRGFDHFGAMARHVLEHAPRRFSLAGHSMGGRVALEVLRLAGARVEQVVLMDFGAHPVSPGERTSRQALLDLAESEGLAAVIDTLVPSMLHPTHRGGPLERRMREMMLRHSVADFRGQIQAAQQREDQSRYLPEISQEVLILVGEQDEWSPVEQHRDTQRRLPRSRLEVIPDSGHMISMEQPERVSELLLEWFGESSTRAPHHTMGVR